MKIRGENFTVNDKPDGPRPANPPAPQPLSYKDLERINKDAEMILHYGKGCIISEGSDVYCVTKILEKEATRIVKEESNNSEECRIAERKLYIIKNAIHTLQESAAQERTTIYEDDTFKLVIIKIEKEKKKE
jgi:hypothetical protein